VIVDLRRMDRIVEYDAELALLTVEPGVTFRQATDFLAERASPYFLAVTGGPADGSIVGNAMERGIATGPAAWSIDNVSALEVVLADGTLLALGDVGRRQSGAAKVNRWGLGPDLSGLFSQSNLGIVSRLTIGLTPKPAQLRVARFSATSPAQLEAIVDAIRSLRLRSVIGEGASLWNDLRVLAGTDPYPWDEVGPEGVLSEQTRGRLAAERGVGRWNGDVPIYAFSAAAGAVAQGEITGALGPLVDAMSFIEVPPEAPARSSDVWYLGTPTDANLRATYWRKRHPAAAGLDPDRDRCGVVFSGHTVPFLGREVRRALDVIDRITRSHRFDPCSFVVPFSARGAYVGAILLFDRDVPEEDRRALECHLALTRALVEAGYPPYRLGIHEVDLALPAGEHRRWWTALKRCFDPAGIIAPGRYDFTGE
jgi:4-cresol dehydrogenase (hydroxylating)